MISHKELIQHKVEEVLQYLSEAPIDLSTCIYHDNLYDLCATDVFNALTDLAEQRADEYKLKDYNK